jgi:hypothetical protein
VRAAQFGNDAAVSIAVERTVAASVYSRAIQKAADLLGGRDRLAKVLLVPVSEIEKWIADKARPPREVFLRVVDIVLDEGAASGESEPFDPAPPRDCAGSSGTEPELL